MVNLVFQPKVPVVWPPAANVCGASACPMEAAFLQGWGRLCKSGGIKFRRTCPEAVGWIMSGQLRVANLKLVKTEFPIRSRMNGMRYPSRETSLSLFSLLFFFFRNGEGKTKKDSKIPESNPWIGMPSDAVTGSLSLPLQVRTRQPKTGLMGARTVPILLLAGSRLRDQVPKCDVDARGGFFVSSKGNKWQRGKTKKRKKANKPR